MSVLTWVDDLAADLQTAGLGTVGTSIFIDQIPPDAENALLLIPYPGQPSDNLQQVQHPRLQVTARNISRAAAQAAITAVYQRWDNQEAWEAGPTPTQVVDCKALQAPFSLGQDELQQWRMVCNFKFCIY